MYKFAFVDCLNPGNLFTMKKEYPKEFQHLLDWCTAQPDDTYYKYVGFGNPEAELLFVGAEPSERLNQEEANKELYDRNLKKWIENTQRLHWWYDSERRDWTGLFSNYQKISDAFRLEGNFLLHAFLTDISSERGFTNPSPQQKSINRLAKRKSIEARIKMFQHEYFQRFRLVILAAKKDTWDFYENGGKNYCMDAFKAKGPTETLLTPKHKVWVYQRETDFGGQYIIHCHQLGCLLTRYGNECRSKFIELVKGLMKKQDGEY